MIERVSRDPIPTVLKVDVTPKKTSSTLGLADTRRVISEMTAMHSGLFSVPVSYMQPAIDSIRLDGTMHDKGTVHPLQIPRTQEVSHAKDSKKGKGKKSLRPTTISMHTNNLNHDVVGVKRGRLEIECSTKVVSTKERRKHTQSEGHDSDKIASTVEADGQPR